MGRTKAMQKAGEAMEMRHHGGVDGGRSHRGDDD